MVKSQWLRKLMENWQAPNLDTNFYIYFKIELLPLPHPVPNISELLFPTPHL